MFPYINNSHLNISRDLQSDAIIVQQIQQKNKNKTIKKIPRVDVSQCLTNAAYEMYWLYYNHVIKSGS